MRKRVALLLVFCVLPPAAWAQSGPSVLGRRTLLPAQVLCTDLPVITPPVATMVVRSGHNPEGRLSLTEGDIAVLSGAPDGLTAGQRYVARRVRGGENALTRDIDGFSAIRTAGWLTITAVEGQTALAKVDFACDPIEPGDFLEAYVEPVLPSTAADQAEPKFSELAHVLFGIDRRENLGDGDVFSIDRGTEQGVSAGDRFAIFRDPKDGAPMIHVADAVVVDPSATTSKAVLVMVRDAVLAGDLAFPRK